MNNEKGLCLPGVDRLTSAGGVAFGGMFVCLLVLYFRYGFLFLDGGYYLSAARGVATGALPYRDVFFPQGPIYPYIYGFIQYFTGTSVQVARFTSLLCALITFLITMRLARRHAGPYAALIVAALFSCNSFVAYHLAVEKLNALTTLWVVLSMYCWLRDESARSLTLALCFMVLATGTRYTLLPALIVMVVAAIVFHRRNMRFIVLPFLSALILGMTITGPFLLICPEQFLYGIIGVHVSAEAGSRYHFGLVGKLGTLSDLVRSMLLLVLISIPVVAAALIGKLRSVVLINPRETVLALIFLVVSLAHFSANWFHSSYQIVLLPVWIYLAACGVTRLLGVMKDPVISTAIIITICCGPFLTIISQGRTYIWNDQQGIASPWLEDLSRKIELLTLPGDKVLTDQPIIAHQASREIVHGFEGAPFTWTPTWSIEQCLRFSTINEDILADILISDNVKLLALTKSSFRMASPGFIIVDDQLYQRVWSMIEATFEPVDRIPGFAGTDETLVLFMPKTRPMNK